MEVKIVGKKIEMTQIFADDGTVIPVTKVLVDQGGVHLHKGDVINVSGVSKGRGFTGVVKRWGFAGGPKTHGQSDRVRAPGSIGGGTDPGRVFKGKKMAGRMGGKNVTVRNLEVVGIDNDYVLIKGGIPGSRQSEVKISVVQAGPTADTVSEADTSATMTDEEQTQNES